jgi:hypothetical protein
MEYVFERDPATVAHERFIKWCFRSQITKLNLSSEQMGLLRHAWDNGYATGVSECLGLHNKELVVEEDEHGSEPSKSM